MNKKTEKIYLPGADDLAKCIKIIEKENNFDDGFVVWITSYKALGYKRSEAFIIVSLAMQLILNVNPIAKKKDKWDLNYPV
jgi:hypothetical protein